MSFHVRFWSNGQIIPTSRSAVYAPPDAEFAPVRWSFQRIGGAANAEINVTGPEDSLRLLMEWLNYDVEIVDDTGVRLWWGYIHGVEVPFGAFRMVKTLDKCHNSVAVAYTTEGDDNEDIRGTTAYAENALSIRQYGRRQLLYPQADMDEAGAEAFADSLLDRFAQPRREFRPSPATSPVARLDCMGHWHRLSRLQYANARGREVYDESGNSSQALGVGFSGRSYVNWVRENRRVYGVGGAEHGFKSGNMVRITGTTINDGSKLISQATGQDEEVYTATTISFLTGGGTDDIYDSAKGFGVFSAGDIIQVQGSTSNDGVYTIGDIEEIGDVAGTDYDHIETGVELTLEAAGASVTIRRHGYVTLDAPVNDEDEGGSDNMTAYGQRIAQSFSLEHDTDSWYVDEAQLRISKTGAPADSVRVAIQADSAGSPSGTNLASATLAASEIGEALSWETWDLGGTFAPAYGTTYWIVVTRTGSNDPDNYFEVAMDEDAAYSRGSCKVYDGAAWQARPTDADMPFQLWGHRDTATQIRNIVVDTGVFPHVSCDWLSGVETREYRDGDHTAIDEIADLVDIGTTDPEDRYVIEVTHNYGVRIDKVGGAAYVGGDLRLRPDGTVTWPGGGEMRAGESCAGYYITIDDAQANPADESPYRFVVERCEFDAQSGVMLPTPMDSWDISEWGEFYERL